MSLHYASLNSGSNANAYYVGTRRYGVLIDAGLSLRQTKKRMQSLGLELESIRAIFISHEHTDHIRALPDIARQLQVPVYASLGTRNAHYCFNNFPAELHRHFACGDVVQIEDINIKCFYKNHDGADPHSFVIERQGIRVGIFTDIGEPCKKLHTHFASCNAAILEANYDDDMLANGHYPFYLKKRISSSWGHLSNAQALELFLNHRSPALSHLVLGHLSKENNTPEKVYQTFEPHQHLAKIFVASRQETSPLFFIEYANCPGQSKQTTNRKATQLSIF